MSAQDHATLRQCTRADFPGMWAVRYAVRENPLSPGRLDDNDMIEETEVSGRGWVIEHDGQVRAFAVGNAQTGNIWALFVDPQWEGRGYGRRLLEVMTQWLWSKGLQRLSLSTDPESRADAFYRRSGWIPLGLTANGERRFELRRESARAAAAD